MLVDELKPIPLNCSNMEICYFIALIISLLLKSFKDQLYRYEYLIAMISIFVHWI